jgi:hypothetical protein
LIIKRQWIDKILAHQKVAWIIEYVWCLSSLSSCQV